MVSLFRTPTARGNVRISEGSTTAEALGSKKEGCKSIWKTCCYVNQYDFIWNSIFHSNTALNGSKAVKFIVK